jgi:hypothetical protein
MFRVLPVIEQILEVLPTILKWICFLVALAWLAMIVFVQISCPIQTCVGQESAAWMAPIFYGAVGLPALIASIVIIVVGIVRRKS